MIEGDARVYEEQLRPEVLRRARRGAEVPGIVRADEDDKEGHERRSWFRIEGMSKGRSEDEQKAVETILWALGHKLHRLRDEYAMKKLRGEEPEGVAKGLDLALREVNDLLPRRKRLKG
jgi:hypothetical protein